MEVVDIHPHIVAVDHIRYPLAPLGGNLSDWVESRPVTFERMVELMDQVGIGRAVLVQAATAHGSDNNYLADSVATLPNRFAGVGNVDMLSADAPDRLTYWVKERGLGGVRIFSKDTPMTRGSVWMDDPAITPVWERIQTLQIPACVQLGEAGFPGLKSIVQRFPDIPVLLDHMTHVRADDGPPYHAADPFFEFAAFSNVYVKLTTRNFVDMNKGKGRSRSFLQRTVDTFGANHIAWGSNFPAQAETLQDIYAMARDELAFLTTAEQESILANTALTLFPSLCQS